MSARAAAIRSMHQLGCPVVAGLLRHGLAADELLELRLPEPARRVLQVLANAEAGRLAAVQVGR